jgi:hypothetical protein
LELAHSQDLNLSGVFQDFQFFDCFTKRRGFLRSQFQEQSLDFLNDKNFSNLTETLMKIVVSFLTLCMLAVNGSAATTSKTQPFLDFAANSVVVPVMANVAGMNGAYFKTRVSILNPTPFPYSIEVTLYGGNGKENQQILSMAPGQVRNYNNFLQDLFSFTGAGSVRFESQPASGGMEDFLFVLNSEVYWDTTNGNFGTAVPAYPYGAANTEAYSLGVNIDSGSRTNIGCFNDNSESNNIEAAVFDSSGNLLDTILLTVPPLSWRQVSLTVPVSGGYIRWRPGLPAYCYAVIVDNHTNDGNFVPAAEFGP